jgi:hypothetical protein
VSADTDIKVLIGRSLDTAGRTEDTVLTAFADGCSGLRCILADAGVAELPMLNWFHIGMRLQHLKQTAGGLATDDPARVAAKAVIVEEVERLHWRLWNGKAKDAQISIDRIRAVMHHFQGETSVRSPLRPRENFGPHCTRWMDISPARAIGWSITPSDTVPDCEWAPRSPRGRPTFR